MAPIFHRTLIVFVFLGCVSPALSAASLREAKVRGVEGSALANVEATLSLFRLPPADRDELSEARLAYLLRRVPDEVDAALQPYGYYDAQSSSEIVRDGDSVDVTIIIAKGEPVMVRAAQIEMQGAAGADADIGAMLRKFKPRIDARLDHRLYEASKLSVQRRLLERGYFDAELVRHRIEVRQQQREATLDLLWRSGERYRFGETRFEGSHIRLALLEQTVRYERGEPYDQNELLALQQRLTELDYFGFVDVRPDLESAEQSQVPIAVGLTPGKRDVYSAGLSFGTDSGAGIQLGLERRWVNDRGHKFASQLDYTQRRKSLGMLYRVPAFAWAEGWYSLGLNRREEESEFVTSRISEAVAQRIGRINGWDLGLGLHVLQESFDLGRQSQTVASGKQRLVYPALSAERKVADDPLYPSRGFLLRGELKLGASQIGSQTDFAQILLRAKLVRSLGRNNRVLLRADLGRTETGEFDEIPPSLRFYAGGDRSIRGYGHQEVGPRIDDQVLGGRNLLVGSVELEHMFTPRWGAAVFVDAGDAFNGPDDFALRTGVGAGVRWRSPVGLVRVDVAHGLDGADSAVQLHINIGPDL